MKLIFTLSLLAASCSSCFAGDLYQHIQLPLMDAYVDSSVDRDPDLPGMAAVRYTIAVSLSSADLQASEFGVYVRVLLADGTQHVIHSTMSRENTGVAGAPTVARFYVGTTKPVKVVAFNVTRFHGENSDQLIRP